MNEIEKNDTINSIGYLNREQNISNSPISLLTNNKIDSIKLDSPKSSDFNIESKKVMEKNRNQLIKISHRCEINKYNELPKIEQTAFSYENFIDSSNFNKIIKENIWKVDIKQTLSQFQLRKFDTPEIKFRIGGRMAHSVSKLIRKKSDFVLQDSEDTQDDLVIEEVEEEEFIEEFQDDLYGNSDDEFDYYSNSDIGSIELINQENNLNSQSQESLALLNKMVIPHSFYNKDKMGRKFLASPVRTLYKPLDFQDLGKALSKTLKYNILKPSKNKNKSSKLTLTKDILPESLVKNAQGKKVNVEEQIQSMDMKIQRLFQENNKDPISFINIIISPDRTGIAQTLLYILQLINREKISLWMNDQEKEDFGVFITPLQENLNK